MDCFALPCPALLYVLQSENKTKLIFNVMSIKNQKLLETFDYVGS